MLYYNLICTIKSLAYQDNTITHLVEKSPILIKSNSYKGARAARLTRGGIHTLLLPRLSCRSYQSATPYPCRTISFSLKSYSFMLMSLMLSINKGTSFATERMVFWREERVVCSSISAVTSGPPCECQTSGLCKCQDRGRHPPVLYSLRIFYYLLTVLRL